MMGSLRVIRLRAMLLVDNPQKFRHSSLRTDIGCVLKYYTPMLADIATKLTGYCYREIQGRYGEERIGRFLFHPYLKPFYNFESIRVSSSFPLTVLALLSHSRQVMTQKRKI